LKVDKPLDRKPGELRCPYCYGKDIVPSLPRGIWDAVMSGMGRVPRHCRFCGRRFHPKLEEVERDAAIRAQTEKAAGGPSNGAAGF
jgi:hypothetical protein